MSNNQYFEPPFAYPKSKLASIRSKKRKRKRTRMNESDESFHDDLVPESSQITWAELLPEDAIQRQVAGLSAGDKIPEDDFPHRSQDYKPYTGTIIEPSQVQKELSNLKPPLIDHIQRAEQLQNSKSSLKQQHIKVMHTLVHKCLLERDFIRAERAFGLLLRTENLGKPPDLRTQNLWGIGAEILLNRNAQANRPGDQAAKVQRSSFDRKGFEDAKKYYENLIIQFPYRNQQSNTLSAVQIYPVLFGFWIASVDDKHHAAVRSITGMSEIPHENYSIEQQDELENIRTSTLDSVREIGKRLDEVLQSIPYSDDPILWKLKGHMYLWINDLSKSQHEEDSLYRSGNDGFNGPDQDDLAQSNAERAFAMARSYEKTRELQQQGLSLERGSDGI